MTTDLKAITTITTTRPTSHLYTNQPSTLTMDSLTRAEQNQLQQRLEKRQVKEFMSLFGNLVDNCFSACVDDFTSKALSGRENGCLQRCVAKSMVTQGRLSERFGELNQAMTAEMQQKKF